MSSNITQLPTEREPYITKRQLAEHYGFSTRWVELRMTEGMPVHRFGTRCRFILSQVDSWMRRTECDAA
jgi:hypothetical protein